MSRQYQESEIEFRRSSDDNEYPVARGIVIHHYGGTLEECIDKARHEFKLGDEWEVITAETSKL